MSCTLYLDSRYKLLESKLESTLKKSLEIKEEKIAALEARLEESTNYNQQLRQELKTVSDFLGNNFNYLFYKYEQRSVNSKLRCKHFDSLYHFLSISTKQMFVVWISYNLFSLYVFDVPYLVRTYQNYKGEESERQAYFSEKILKCNIVTSC